jgi:adenylate cyclase
MPAGCSSPLSIDQVRDRLPFVFEDLGKQQVKNIARPVRVDRVSAAAIVDRSPGKTPPIGSLR